jgi:hypothetical protein
MVLGGGVSIALTCGSSRVYSGRWRLPPLAMNCTNAPWTNRLCRFSNLSFGDDRYGLVSPYALDFERELLCLGSKTPPVDFDPN